MPSIPKCAVDCLLRHLVVGTLPRLLSLVLALACPDFEFLVAFIGAFCNSMICYVLPPLMYCALVRGRQRTHVLRVRDPPADEGAGGVSGGNAASLASHALLVALGICVLVGATYTVVADKLRR